MPIDTIVPNSLRYGLCLGDGPGVGVSQLLWELHKANMVGDGSYNDTSGFGAGASIVLSADRTEYIKCNKRDWEV
jgi:hypothetical protein